MQERKIKRFTIRKEIVKTNLNSIIDIETLMSMSSDELKALKKTITKVNGLKKTYNAIYNPVIVLTESVSVNSESETESETESVESVESVEEEKESVFVAEIPATNIQQEQEQDEDETDVKALDEYYTEENKMFNDYQKEINNMKLAEQIILNTLKITEISVINIMTTETINTPIEAEPKNEEIMTPAIEEYDIDILSKIIKKYNPESVEVKSKLFKEERKFINKLIEEFKCIKTVRHYKKQIDMSGFDIYELDLKPEPDVELKIFKTTRPDNSINSDNVDEIITKNNIYINRKQTKKKDKVEFILLNDILIKIKSDETITEKERIIIEKKYCKDEFKRDQFSYYYNENFVIDPYKIVY